MTPRPKPHHSRIGAYYVQVWRGESAEEKAASRTTWPIPVGATWEAIAEKCIGATYKDGATLTSQEAMAVKSLVYAYAALLDTPNWRRQEIAKAYSEAVEKDYDL